MWEALGCAGFVLLLNGLVLGPFMYFALQAECQPTGNKAYITPLLDPQNHEATHEQIQSPCQPAP